MKVSKYQDFDTRNNTENFSFGYFTSSRRLQIENLIDENKSLVIKKQDFDHRCMFKLIAFCNNLTF